MANVSFERRDVGAMASFLVDFGFIPLAGTGDTSYFRGHGPAAWLVRVRAAAEDRFVGFGLTLRSAADLEALSAATGVSVRDVEAPGGGRYVRLHDPSGLAIDAIHGAATIEPLPTRSELVPVNTPGKPTRINAGVRTPIEPSPIFRLGHIVLQHPGFDEVAGWYMQHFGLIPSDVQFLSDGSPALGFFRLDRGDEPTDHHSVAILGGPATAILHVAWETFDLESVGQGHQYLRAKGWIPYWGIGRHKLGSQIFDYWKDPVGNEWEHYADGDLMDASQPTGYHELHRGTLWAWGDDLPDSMRPNLSLDDIPKIHAAGGFGTMDLASVTELMKALLVKPRPWME
jgi:hypothetical protein